MKTFDSCFRVFFLCSSLEHGQDGVGDYTSRLLLELLALGHSCQCVAINDLHLSGSSDHSCPQKNQFRLPAHMSWRERIHFVQNAISEFNPDLVSLQYVPHAYSPKGLPLLLPYRLASIHGNFRWHVMFHELWLESNGFYRTILSFAQRLLLSTLCRKLAPVGVHTSNQNYAEKLASVGVPALVLPVFSNIDLASPNNRIRTHLLKKFNLELNSDSVWIFVFFGSIHPGWDYDCFIERVSKASSLAKKVAVIFLSIGKNQGAGAEIWKSMQASPSQIIRFLHIGELSANDVSQYLQTADFGIATTPFSLLGKSGSAAAYASHGLPTIVPRMDVAEHQESPDFNRIIQLDKFFEQNLINPPKPRKRNSSRQTAEYFLEHIESYIKKQ